MKRFVVSFTFIGIVLLFTACGGGRTYSVVADSDTIPFHYATNIQVIKGKEFSIAELRNPWDTTKMLHTYILVPKNQSLPHHLPQGTIVRTPLSKAVIYSSVHCSLLVQLGASKAIGGVCDLKYMQLPLVQHAYQKGTIGDMGDSMAPNIEKIIDLHPDAILLSPFENSGGYGRIEKLNIPIVECADYMETSALGRAEWMKFYGLLFGCEEKAEKLFAIVEKSYLSLRNLAATSRQKPLALAELKSGSAWYVPGGQSNMGRLYQEAGMNYMFSNDKHTGSVPLAFEVVFDKAQQADIWLIKYNQAKDKTYSDLKQEYATYASFKAFKNRQIYACNTHKVSFYEETTFHPDWLLQDLIVISHPELLKGTALRYYSRMKE